MKEHNHSTHHKEEMIKNLIQAENHLTKDYCPECLNKHLLGAEAYMEEEVSTNPNANPELLELAQRVREIRRRLQKMENIRHLKKLEEIS